MGGIVYRKNSKPMGEKFTGGVAVNLKARETLTAFEMLSYYEQHSQRNVRGEHG